MKIMVVAGYAGRLEEIESHGLLSRDREYYTALQRALGYVCVASPDRHVFRLDSDGRVIHVPLVVGKPGMRGLLSQRRLLGRALDRFRPDAVVADMTSAPLWLGRPLRAPLITRAEWFWSDVSRQEDSLHEAKAKAVLERYMALRSAAVSASTSLVAGRMRALGAERIEVVPNFVAREFFSEGAGRRAVDEGKRGRILSVGRLVAIKRHALLIDALALVQEERRPTLVLVGQGPLRDELLDRACRQAVRVELVDRVANARLAGLMADADALVHASSHEGAPRVIIEAFAAGLPVLSVKWQGVEELVGQDLERGVLLPEDASGIARRIEELNEGILDERLMDASAAARDWALAECSLDAHIALTQRLITEILSGWRRT